MVKIGECEVYTPITFGRKILGWALISVGVLTLPIPVTTPLLVGLGCIILMMDFKKVMKTIKFYSKELIYFIWRKLKYGIRG